MRLQHLWEPVRCVQAALILVWHLQLCQAVQENQMHAEHPMIEHMRLYQRLQLQHAHRSTDVRSQNRYWCRTCSTAIQNSTILSAASCRHSFSSPLLSFLGRLTNQARICNIKYVLHGNTVCCRQQRGCLMSCSHRLLSRIQIAASIASADISNHIRESLAKYRCITGKLAC